VNESPLEPAAPDARRFLLRFGGELATKSRPVRRHFARRLLANVRDALRAGGLPGRAFRTHDRVFVEVRGDRDPDCLQRVFGVQSVAEVVSRPVASVEDVVAAGERLFGDAVAGRTFAVRARRVGDKGRIGIRSGDVQRALGTALLPGARGVDLSHPEVVAHVELMPGEACFFRTNRPGPGGLPIGVEGQAVALLSGGFDSAVAAWQVLRRGVRLDYVLCNLGGREHQLEVLRVAKVLSDRWSYGSRPRIHCIDFDDVTRALQAHCQPRMWQVVLKRLMLRAAEGVAADVDAQAIVTGDAIGQVSSQTLPNLNAISDATRLPVLRPLVGANKQEILAAARAIGTYELSEAVGEYCALVPSKPATSSSVARARGEEDRIDLGILSRAVAERSVFDLRRLDLASMDAPELQVASVPEGATVLDLRSKPAYSTWHWPDALFLDFADALRAYPHFARDQRYVLYCELGLKSAHLAELMRREGLDAWHFDGGLGPLLAHARERGLPTPESDG